VVLEKQKQTDVLRFREGRDEQKSLSDPNSVPYFSRTPAPITPTRQATVKAIARI
jgi:hypothetical protein